MMMMIMQLEIGIWAIIWLCWGGDVARNNYQEIAANIRKEEDNVDFNDEEEKGVDNQFNNLCNQNDTYDDANLVVGGGVVAGNKKQNLAAEPEAESTVTENTTSSQATHTEDLVTGTNRSAYLMQKTNGGRHCREGIIPRRTIAIKHQSDGFIDTCRKKG
jgi:hypothetical protein